MKKPFVKSIGLGFLGWALGTAAAFAAETQDVAVAESSSPAVPAETPAAAASNETPAVVVEPVPVETPAAEAEPAKPKKEAPVYRGSDMKDAFQGTGSSRFGVSGRVNKMPAKTAPQKEAGAWKRSLEMGASTASGNSDILRYSGAASAAKETEVNYLFLKAEGRYGESDNERDTENATGEAKFQRRLTERTYAALDGNAHHDQIADLAYRIRGSLSLGRRFIWSDRTVLSAEAGPGYVAEKKGGEPEGFVAGRAAQYLEFLLADNLQIWQSVEFVQNVEDSSVYFVNAEVGLEVVLVANLNLRFSVEDSYDSQPAEGKESNDLLTTTALAWSF